MDIAPYLQCFESRLSSYTGDDPLDPWDKFVEYLEQRFPADAAGSGMSVVFDTLVQKFLNVERYANDVRFVKHCIKCASFYSDPIALYSHVFSKGVGTRTAALYVAWAQQFEQRGLNEQADAVYQKALENQAQPVDTVLNEHKLFKTRTRSHTQVSAGGPNLLQNLTNQMSSHREPAAPNKVSADCLSKPPNVITTVSRSETSGKLPSTQSSSCHTVSQYMKDQLVCEGSEYCFEEVRAQIYFLKLREKKEKERRGLTEKMLMEQREAIHNIKCMLDKVNQGLEVSGGLTSEPAPPRLPFVETSVSLNANPSQQAFGRPRPSSHLSSRHSLGLRLPTEPTFTYEAAAAATDPPRQLDSAVAPRPSALTDRSGVLPNAAPSSACFQQMSPAHFPAANTNVFWQAGGVEDGQPASNQDDLHPPDEKLSMSQGGTGNLSHVTPNTSLGFAQATPSRVLPSPTVNTREALDVIMDMFQAPTLLEDPFPNTSVLHAAEREVGAERPRTGGVFPSVQPSAAAPFTIFQDDTDKENGRAAAPPAPEKAKPIRALAEIPAPNKPNETPPDLVPDESTTWGACYNSLNSLAACPNSTTDFAMSAQFVSTPFTRKTLSSGGFYQDQENICDAEDEAATRRQLKKLSPIIETSPSDETLSETLAGQRAPSSDKHGTIVGEGLSRAQLCLTSSSITMVLPPPPAVLSFRDHTICPDPPRAAAPSWEVYTSPERPHDGAGSSAGPRREPFTIMEDLHRPERVQTPAYDVPMSPDCAPKPDWLAIRSPEATAEPDLDAFLSPTRIRRADPVPMSPDPPQLCADVPMSPALRDADRPESGGSGVDHLVSDPWSEELISSLLSALSPPLTAHPRCITWQCNVPNISPKTTISMGKASLRVDGVIGEGAFATVYQATDPTTSDRMVLKVQKPANPWEFYINAQLDARLRPEVRHLYSNIRSAHLFHDGSVLLGELHNYGTLLNAVNIYKTLSDKVMPQPLVMYFTICILNMVEQLHDINVIHADIKPDNFLLGERFLENKCFEPENVDHGLVLIDLGQSIDMQVFPEGTAFTSKCLTSGFQCTEMLSGKPWNYQTDYFGLAGTVHCMLFGSYMQVSNKDGVWRTDGVFRRNPHSDLWQDFFHTLLNVPDGGRPSLPSLRRRLASVLQQNYSSKLLTLKSRLVVLLLESRKGARR